MRHNSIHAYYEPEELIGKTCIAITNLPPRAMMGIDSCGMLLSAVHKEGEEEKLHLLMVDPHIPAGAKLYCFRSLSIRRPRFRHLKSPFLSPFLLSIADKSSNLDNCIHNSAGAPLFSCSSGSFCFLDYRFAAIGTSNSDTIYEKETY
jgi:hypothetical protein